MANALTQKNERKRSNEILASYAEKPHIIQRERQVSLNNYAYKDDKSKREHKVNRICIDDIIAAITAKITAITTQKLHRRKQRKRPEKKLDLFSKKCWTSSLFCGMLLC